MQIAKFTKINDPFCCSQCGIRVPIADTTCRDHCPSCLYSLHVDVNPGDRAANCGGLLKPISYETHPKKGFVINYKCVVCGMGKRNKFLDRDSQSADSYDALLRLHLDIK